MNYCLESSHEHELYGMPNKPDKINTVVYSSDSYAALESKTNSYGVTLWKMLHHGSKLEDSGRRNSFYNPPSWLLLFRLGPTRTVSKQMEAVRDSMISDGQVKKFRFHSKTGQLSQAFYDYLITFTDEDSRLDFIIDFISYIKGYSKRFPYPPLGDAPLLKTLKFKWFAEHQYTKALRKEFGTGKNRVHRGTTQDATVFFKLPLTQIAEIMSQPLSRAVCLTELYRMDLQG